MSIGGALAEARREAGLSITDVSERSRIRAAIIRDIEHDDYAACGGDFYARGHIRAIAKVVGADPVPLIAEYDAARRPHDDLDGLAGGLGAAAAAGSDRGGRAGRSGLDRLTRGAEPRPRLTAALALALLAAIGLLIYLLISESSGDSSVPKAHSRVPAARHHRATPARHNGHAAAPGTAGAGTGQPPPAVLLMPAAIAAFGPGGTGQSDDPHAAALAIDGSSRTAWHTSWYTTPAFGGLQSGTGLLLDMGRPVAVASARVLFGPAHGGAFELRAGNSPALASLQPVAQAADSGGAVSVRVSRPVRARYLLVWITRLPSDNAGTYQVFIYDVTVRGAR